MLGMLKNTGAQLSIRASFPSPPYSLALAQRPVHTVLFASSPSPSPPPANTLARAYDSLSRTHWASLRPVGIVAEK